MGIANLMRRGFESENLEPIGKGLIARLQNNPADALACLDLSVVFELGGDLELAIQFQNSALAMRQHYRLQSSKDPNAIKVLAIKSRGAIMDNMPIEFLVEDGPIQLESLYVGQGIPSPQYIPDHDVAVVAICESDANQDLLANLSDVVEHWPAPVLNQPSRIACLARDRIGDYVSNIPGLVFPASVRYARDELREMTSVQSLPESSEKSDGWVIRPVNTHAGNGLARITNRAELMQYLEASTAQELVVAPFIPYASEDGVYRKYRIALIQGESYPVHMAISQRWMVHYLNADMLENPQHREEEAAFMDGYSFGFGNKHRRTLRNLSNRLGLDYVVLDCAETVNGKLLLFEADNGAVVHSMDPVDIFPYKRPAMERIFAAFERMLMRSIPAKSNRMVA
jgi:hypothetical protein